MSSYPRKFSGLYIKTPGIGTQSFTVSSSWGEYSAFSAADAIYTTAIFVSPGTHYCWVDRGGGFKACLWLLQCVNRMQVLNLLRALGETRTCDPRVG